MPCYKPLDAFRGGLLPSGKRAVVFNRKDAVMVSDFKLPCGQCIGCRLERSRQWAMRCVDEASLYSDNSFVTLTYDNQNLPSDGGLRVVDFQLFMKRLRQDVWERSHRRGVRFFHCGEYGFFLSVRIIMRVCLIWVFRIVNPGRFLSRVR